MKLLTSQKDTLFEMIEEENLSPSQFQFSEVQSKISPVTRSTELRFNTSDYFFRFETGYERSDPHYAVYCPGEDVSTDEYYSRKWNVQLEVFQLWLTFLIREINSPNKWHRLEKEIEGIKINFQKDEDKFSVEEYEELKKKVSILKNALSTIHLIPEQLSAISSKLDHLTEMGKQLNKFDWKGLFIGSIISIIIQLEVTTDNAKALWNLIRQTFSNYFLP